QNEQTSKQDRTPPVSGYTHTHTLSLSHAHALSFLLIYPRSSLFPLKHLVHLTHTHTRTHTLFTLSPKTFSPPRTNTHTHTHGPCRSSLFPLKHLVHLSPTRTLPHTAPQRDR